MAAFPFSDMPHPFQGEESEDTFPYYFTDRPDGGIGAFQTVHQNAP